MGGPDGRILFVLELVLDDEDRRPRRRPDLFQRLCGRNTRIGGGVVQTPHGGRYGPILSRVHGLLLFQ